MTEGPPPRADRPPAIAPNTVGLMGGTFDPIHVGHLIVAEDVRQQLGLEWIDFLPAGQPQLRPAPPSADGDHRAAMVALAIAGNPHFRLERFEVDRALPTFAAETLKALHARDRAAGRTLAYTFIVSEQTLLTLPRWKDPRRVLELARLAVVPRPGTPDVGPAWVETTFPGLVDRVSFVDAPRIDLSATAIRDRIRAGWTIRYLVPEAVRAYINDHQLYRP